MLKICSIIGQIMILLLLILLINNIILSSTTIPIKIEEHEYTDPLFKEIEHHLLYLNAPEDNLDQLINAIYLASNSTSLDCKLITSLMYTESKFKLNAVGPQNKTDIRYKGLMQTPTASWFYDVDTLHGARILEEKLKISKNDLRLALALYKGGKNKMAFKQADDVLKIYQNLQNYSISE
ncbi:MAG: hypothetical protein PHD05_00075 [Sphaerochaetaceae bacterium]|nr:hypothetical protein [Sphaerochaetaceae bacterium]